MHAGEWNPRRWYDVGSVVTLDGRKYEALEANERIAPDSPKSMARGTWRELEADATTPANDWANVT